MKNKSSFLFALFVFFAVPAFLVIAQTPEELRHTTAEEFAKILADKRAETERLRTELARLRAEQQANESKIKTFVIPWDCSQYPNVSARQMCESAHAEFAKNSGHGSHEASHAINSMCRETPAFRNKRSGTCIQVGWADDGKGGKAPLMTWIDEPKNTTIKGLDSSGCVPGFLKICKPYQTYVVESQILPPGAPRNAVIQTALSFLLDEGNAYIIGAHKNIKDELKRGNKVIDRVALQHVIREPVIFTILSASILQYIEKNDPVRFTDKDFRLFVKLQIEKSMDVIREALSARNTMGAFRNSKGQIDNANEAQDLIEKFIGTPQAQLLRDMYGDAWFNRTFNIDF